MLEVERVVENSPAARAGLLADDLVLEVTVGDAEPRELRRASEWRQIELEAQPGTEVVLFVDSAGREARTSLTLTQRITPPERTPSERYREEQRVGVVVRTATEVEARGAGLGPGGGAVVVGLSARSPWRTAGLRFDDLIVAVDGAPLLHPQDLLRAIRDEDRDQLTLTWQRGAGRTTADATLSRREHAMTEITLPLLFSYEADRGRSEWSMLLGIFHYESTAAAWRFRLLWLIAFGGGDADQLLESGS
jgi:S1-C subfamily serine protease